MQTLSAAWEEYWLWPEDGAPDFDGTEEATSIFLPWFFYNWEFIPEEYSESGPADKHSELEKLTGNICKQLLSRYPKRLDSAEQSFIEAANTTHFSFYQVLDVAESQSMLLKDLLTGKEVTVSEQQAATRAVCGSALYTRVLMLDGVNMMFGTSPYPIVPHMIAHIIEFKQHYLPKRFTKSWLKKYQYEIRDFAHQLTQAMFEPPSIQNVDGETVRPTTVKFRLSCTPQEAMDALAPLAEKLSAIDLKYTASYDKASALYSVDFPWLKPNSHSVLGGIEIRGDELSIDVLSNERADQAKKKVEHYLGAKAKFLHSVSESLESMLDEQADKSHESDFDDEHENLMENSEIQAIVQ